VLAVAPLREEAGDQWRVLPLPGSPAALIPGAASDAFGALADAAVDFVEVHHPNNPEMLLGAGTLGWTSTGLSGGASAAGASVTARKNRILSLLKRAAESRGGPAAWAAYAGAVIHGVEFDRLGMHGVDPGDPQEVAEARRDIADGGKPDRISGEAAQAFLECLREWQEADPKNGMPVAVEAWLLYGLHEDERALARWEEASRLLLVTAHTDERRQAARQVLRAMGLPQTEAALFALAAGGPWDALSRALRDGARMAYNQGRLAQMSGHEAEALQVWTATIALGRHMMESADNQIEFLVGSALQSIGAMPAWVWEADKRTGVTGGPLLGGRIWYGSQHDAYAGWVGQQQDNELRESLVVAKARAGLLRKYNKGVLDDKWFSRMAAAMAAPRLAWNFAAPLILLLLLYAVVSLWARRRDAGAASRGQEAEAGTAFFWPLAATASLGALAVWAALTDSGTVLVAGFFLWGVGCLIGGAIMMWYQRRRPRPRPRQSWMQRLRRGVPQWCAVTALLYLSATSVGAIAKSKLMRDLSGSETKMVIEAAGDAWRNPSIPPDSWRAAYPPKRATE